MSKDAILMIVDVGHSMQEKFSQDKSRVKIALECCKLTLQQKIFNNSSHQVGIILFGDNESDDGNSLFLQNLGKPNVELVRKVEALSYANFNNEKAGGDIFNAISYGYQKMMNHCGKKKYNKRIFVFTNGMGKTNIKNLKKIGENLRNDDVKVNIIPIDFMVSYDIKQNRLDDQIMTDDIQQENARLLMELKQIEPDSIQIFPASLAIELYKRFRKRDTNPVATFKGSFEIAPGLEIEVSAYKAIKRQKLKSLARYDKSIQFDPTIKPKEVVVEINYTVEGEASGSIVDKEDIINAYYYGPQLVPINKTLEGGTKIFEQKNFKLLFFVDKTKIPRHCLMGEVDILVPSSDIQSRKLFTSFIYSMLSLNKYGVARYVARNNKNGVNPKMVVLIPYRSTERQMFYLIQLPTVEDVRDYPFNSLKTSSERQKDLVRQLVDRMMLYKKDQQEEIEQVKIENTFNPTRQYFYQAIFYKALNEDNGELPPLDPIIKKYISPELSKYEKTKQIMAQIKKEFRFIKKNLLKNKQKQKQTILWKNIIESQKSTQAISQQNDIKLEEQVIKHKNFFSIQNEDQEMKFNAKNPIVSFKKMINYNKTDLVSEALKQMIGYIENKLKLVVSDQSLKSIAECAAQMRKGCVDQMQPQVWDDWFKKMSEYQPSFYHTMRSEGLGYIRESNIEIFKPQMFHPLLAEDNIDDLD